jgi:BirA family biotin operon repressor/biotin-[acetyl-CoA-carboxylase] ligase
MSAAPVVHFETVSSTMDEMAEMLATGTVEPWTAVVADYQIQGRGRADRSWLAPSGSALLTTIYAPIEIDTSRIGMLSIAAGLAVADAVADLGLSARLKWPNDVLVNDRKLAGILISTRIGARIDALIGIGLNLTSAPPGAVALSDLCAVTPPTMDLLDAIRDQLMGWCANLDRGHFNEVCNHWTELAAWTGEVVTVPGDESLTGTLVGVDEWGRLVIRTTDGEILLGQSEIARGPIPAGSASYTLG